METLYWLLQYMWVLISFIFIMYIWPSVIFRKHLKGKNRTYRFAFCTVVMVVIINTACIALGLMHILYPKLYAALFFGSFLFSLLKGKRISSLTIRRFKYMVSGTYGTKSMFSDIGKYIRGKIKAVWKCFMTSMKGCWFEYVSLGILVLFGLIYYSYGSLKIYSFGCGDIYTHMQWIYNLTKGVIFSSGIYPEGMHFFIYSEYALMGAPIYSGVLFTGCINMFVTLISLYILLKEVFTWKHTAKLALLAFLILDVTGSNEFYSIARMQWSLPQEFGYPALFLCTAYLIKFLRHSVVKKKDKATRDAEKKILRIPFIKKQIKIPLPLCLKDGNLFIFSMALAVTIIIHFYSTIMAFFLCLGVAVVLLGKIFTRKFLPLVISVLFGLMVSILPMAISFASGIRLQGSLYWAMSLFMPKEEVVEEQPSDAQNVSQTSGENTDVSGEQADGASGETVSESKGEQIQGQNGEESDRQSAALMYPVATNTMAASKRVIAADVGIAERLVDIYDSLQNAYVGSYGSDRGKLFFVFSLISLILGILASISRLIYVKINDLAEKGVNRYIGYIILACMGIMCHLFIISGKFGIPTIMEMYRIYATALMMTIPMFFTPLDFVISLLPKKIPELVMDIAAGVLLAAFYIGVILTGNFHGYLMYQVTRYNSSVMVTKQIVNTLPAESYTIVSTTDEYYQIVGNGYHEELIQFFNESEQVSYTIPTNYIFLFVEKNAIARNQDHYFTGPGWLAENGKDAGNYRGEYSEDDMLNKQSISEEMANVYFGKFPANSGVYGSLWMRVVLNSKIYVWCQKFNAMYPNELHIYYEDDDFICYYLKQNPRNLYELAAMDTSMMIPAESYSKPIWPESFKAGALDE